MSQSVRPQVLLINHSDIRGGASVVSLRLMHALCRNGVDARMLVMHKDTDDLRVATAASPTAIRTAFLAEEAQLFAADGFSRRHIFSLSTASFGVDILRHPWVREADAFILNWVNQGMLSLKGISRLAALGRPVAWTMHDMWPLTALCHHAGNCTQYTGNCEECPMIRTRSLARRVHARKAGLYAGTKIKFVPVSNWLADKCRQSSLLRDADVTVIPNAFPVEDFAISPTLSRQQLGLPANDRLIVMGAARLDDPVKNLPLAVAALNRLADNGLSGVSAVFYGSVRDTHALDTLRLPHICLGTVPQDSLPQIYAHATAVLSTSHYETLPGTLVEGMAAGCTPVACGKGGQPDIVTDGLTGYLPASDPADVADALARAVTSPMPRDAQHHAVAQLFDRNTIANKYIKLLDI